MTLEQRHRYFRLWNEACRVAKWENSDNERYAFHRSIGLPESSGALTNPQITRLFHALKAVINPRSLKKQVRDVSLQMDPTIARREQLIHSINAMAAAIDSLHGGTGDPDAYLREICGDINDTRAWRELPITAPNYQDLTNLRNTINNRLSALFTKVKDGEIRNTLPLSVFAFDGRPVSNRSLIDCVISGRRPVAPAEVSRVPTTRTHHH